MTLVRSIKLPARHPGIVFRKVLEKQNVSISDAANNMHVDHPQLNNFTIGKFDVTIPFAKKLELSTGISAEFWLNLQNTYDLFIHRNLSTNCEPLL